MHLMPRCHSLQHSRTLAEQAHGDLVLLHVMKAVAHRFNRPDADDEMPTSAPLRDVYARAMVGLDLLAAMAYAEVLGAGLVTLGPGEVGDWQAMFGAYERQAGLCVTAALQGATPPPARSFAAPRLLEKEPFAEAWRSAVESVGQDIEFLVWQVQEQQRQASLSHDAANAAARPQDR